MKLARRTSGRVNGVAGLNLASFRVHQGYQFKHVHRIHQLPEFTSATQGESTGAEIPFVISTLLRATSSVRSVSLNDTRQPVPEDVVVDDEGDLTNTRATPNLAGLSHHLQGGLRGLSGLADAIRHSTPPVRHAGQEKSGVLL